METPGFVADIFPPRLLYCRTIRSPVARGKLLSVECPKLPNNYALVTAKDIPGVNRLADTAHPILADAELSYIGEPVALLLGPDITRLDEFLGQCNVRTAEEKPFFSGGEIPDGAVLAGRIIAAGNPGAAFEQAASVVENVYRTGIQEHWYSEPVGAVAHIQTEDGEGDKTRAGRFVVYTATQWPSHVKNSVALALKLDESRVKVEATIVGLHMDGKLWYPSLIACHAALGAYITKRPVKLVLTKEEDFRFSPKRCASEISVKSALDDRGAVLAAEISVTTDMGAFGIQTAEILDQTCLGALGVYHLENYRLSGRAIQTNIPPQGPFSGFGLAQGFFAAERHASRIADLRKQNPAEWRKENYQRNWTLPPGLAIKENPPAEQLLDTAASMSDYYRKWASCEIIRQSRRKNGWHGETGEKLRGIGIAFGYQGSGFLYLGKEKENCGVELTLEKDASLEIKTVVNSADSDFLRIWANTAAEILGIEAAKVRLNNGEAAPDSGPSCASRNITALTKLVERACLDIRKQRFRDPLPITVRRSLKPRRNSRWEEVLPPLEHGHFDASGFARPGWAAAVVEVEIDPVEYTPRVRGAWLGIDGGKILSEERARRSLKIAAIQALGWAGREEISYPDGSIPRSQFDDYAIPGPADMPPIHIDFIWNDAEEARGIGELPFTCVPAAFLQAASQALDYHFHSIPLTPRDIWEAVKTKKEQTPP